MMILNLESKAHSHLAQLPWYYGALDNPFAAFKFGFLSSALSGINQASKAVCGVVLPQAKKLSL